MRQNFHDGVVDSPERKLSRTIYNENVINDGKGNSSVTTIEQTTGFLI